jgi:hypothetical protein
MMKAYAVCEIGEALDKLAELIPRDKCVYRSFYIEKRNNQDGPEGIYFSVNSDNEKLITNRFYGEKNERKKLSPEIKPSWHGVVYDDISMKIEVLKPFLNKVKIRFNNEDRAYALFGDIARKAIDFDDLAKLTRELTAHNKINRNRDYISFDCDVPFFSRILKFTLPLINVDITRPDETIPAKLVTNSMQDHPYFKGCLVAIDLCKYLVDVSYQSFFSRKKKKLIHEESSPLRKVRVYECSEGIIAKFEKGLGGRLFYDLHFQDCEFVRENLPFIYLLAPGFKYVSRI